MKVVQEIYVTPNVYSTYLIGRKKVIKEEEGFSLVLQVDGKIPSYTCTKEALKFKSTFALKATSDLPQKKNSPIKSLFLRFHMVVSQPHRSWQRFVYSYPWRKSKLKEAGKPPN